MPPVPTIRDRFPLPWQVEQTPGGYALTDANGRRLAFLYVRPHVSAPGLTEGEARSIARTLVEQVNASARPAAGGGGPPIPAINHELAKRGD